MEYLTMKEVAEMLNVSVNTVKTWIKKEKIKYVKVDRLVRIPVDQFKK